MYKDRYIGKPLRRAFRLFPYALTLSCICGSLFAMPQAIADGDVQDPRSFLNSVDPSESQPPPGFVPQQQMQSNYNPNAAPYNPGSMPQYQGSAPPAGVPQQQQQPQTPQAVSATNVLPVAFIGKWSVAGNCTKLEARPDLMERAEAGFKQDSTDTWTIKGKPGKYVLAHAAGSEKVEVGPGNAETIFFNYKQKPAKNGTQTINAVVLKLQPDGKAFSGILRVTVIHPNEDITRAQATYNLIGRRL